MTAQRNGKSRVLLLAFLLTIFSLWELLPSSGVVSEFVIPRFSKVLLRVIDLLNPTSTTNIVPNGLYHHLFITLYQILVAFVITLVSGVFIGFALGTSKMLNQIFEPLIYIYYAFPSVVLYPLVILVFGFGPASKIVFGFLLGLPPLILTIIAGLRSLTPTYIKIARAFGASNIQLFFKILVRASLPVVVSGMRLALSFNIIGVLFGELVASFAGLGWVITLFTFRLDSVTEYAIIWLSILISFCLIYPFKILEARWPNR